MSAEAIFTAATPNLSTKWADLESNGVMMSSPGGISFDEVRNIIGDYNKMYSFLYRYMMREVGPIAEHVLSKYLVDLRENNSSVFKNVSLKKDGTLDEETIAGNLNWLRAESKREALVNSLNEFLYSAILAVKRTLGPDHERLVIETLKDVRPEL